jgi:hypothetical protein
LNLLNPRKIFTLLAAAAAIAASAVVCVIAAACALHAFALQYMSPAGAAAVVAAIFALVAVVIALLLTRKAAPKPARVVEEPPLTDRLIQLARDRPVVAGAAAIAAAVFVARNPKIMNVVLSAALATKAARSPSKKP